MKKIKKVKKVTKWKFDNVDFGCMVITALIFCYISLYVHSFLPKWGWVTPIVLLLPLYIAIREDTSKYEQYYMKIK